jgi:glyoxylase-like metal-dependent hydrolase (beta-lactamase superfamily II)
MSKLLEGIRVLDLTWVLSDRTALNNINGGYDDTGYQKRICRKRDDGMQSGNAGHKGRSGPHRYPDAADQCREMAQRGRKRGEIKYLINTEEHADHWHGSSVQGPLPLIPGLAEQKKTAFASYLEYLKALMT